MNETNTWSPFSRIGATFIIPKWSSVHSDTAQYLAHGLLLVFIGEVFEHIEPLITERR